MAHIGNSPASYFTAVTTDVFSANGTATAFTLSKYVSNLADLEIVVNNIQQNPYSGSYSVSNNTLTFSEAPLAGSNNIVVTYRQATIGSTIPTPNTVGNNALQRDLSLTGNTTTQHLVPAANVTYDIGTSTMRYRDLYLSGNTISLGDLALSTNGTSFSVMHAQGGMSSSALGNTVITGTLAANTTTITGNVSVTGNTTLTGTLAANATTIIGNVSITGSTTLTGTTLANGIVSLSTVSSTSGWNAKTLVSSPTSNGSYIFANRANNTTGEAGFGWSTANTNKWIAYMPTSSDDLGFYNGTLNTFYLAANGNVGVSNSTPTYKLTVANQVMVGGQGGADISILGGGSGVGAYAELRYANGSINSKITGNQDSYLNALLGNVGIGTPSPTQRLTVVGNIIANGYIKSQSDNGNSLWIARGYSLPSYTYYSGGNYYNTVVRIGRFDTGGGRLQGRINFAGDFNYASQVSSIVFDWKVWYAETNNFCFAGNEIYGLCGSYFATDSSRYIYFHHNYLWSQDCTIIIENESSFEWAITSSESWHNTGLTWRNLTAGSTLQYEAAYGS
jgi:hypothetical protein